MAGKLCWIEMLKGTGESAWFGWFLVVEEETAGEAWGGLNRKESRDSRLLSCVTMLSRDDLWCCNIHTL